MIHLIDQSDLSEIWKYSLWRLFEQSFVSKTGLVRSQASLILIYI